MEPLTDVRQISSIAYGYMASKILFESLELDLFSKLAGGAQSLEQLAASTGIAANRMQPLLVSLVSQGLLGKAGDAYSNAPASQNYLVRGAPGDFGDYLKVVNGRFMYFGFTKLGEALRGEQAFSDQGFYEGMFYHNDLDAADFTAAQHAGSLGPAALLARRLDLSGRERLLDVGGGSGAFSIGFCQRNPALQATILDFAGTVETARHYAAEAGLSSRISHLEGNALTTGWPGNQDVVLMSYLWSAVGAGDIERLARLAVDALKPGGLVLVHDFMTTNERTGPQIAAWHLMASTIDNPTASCLSPGVVEEQLARAGFTALASSELLPGITRFTQAQKPA